MKGVRWLLGSANPGQALGRYEPEHEAQFIQLLQGSSVLWDVGAHVGWYSMLAAKHLPQNATILSFEPNPKNVNFLERHWLLNGFTQIKVHSIALCNSNGSANYSDNAQQSHLRAEGEYKVKNARSDDYMDELKTAPDFLKGAERLISINRPQILLSAHGHQKRDQCIDWLEKHEYTIRHLVSNEQQGDYVFHAIPPKD